MSRPLNIPQIRQQYFSASPLKFESVLADGDGYTKQIISYSSDGYRIHALLTIPQGPPNQKFPLVVFNRGYVDPKDFRTDRQYLRYLDFFARHGFVVFKSDYRGIGNSQGEPGSLTTSDNSADVCQGIASLGAIPQIDFDKCFIWGHSMGAMVSLQTLLIPSSNISSDPHWLAGSLWAGFVIPYAEIITRWQGSNSRQKNRAEELLQSYGDPKQNPESWRQISPWFFLNQLPCPLQIHHGTLDASIPQQDSIRFYAELKKVHQDGGLFIYPNGDHNLSGPELAEAMQNTLKFFQSKT